MSWRGKYIGWYKIIEKTLDGLVPNLNDLEIMENVSSDNHFLIPSKEVLPNNLKKPLAKISLRLNEEYAELGIFFNNQESIVLFSNIFKDFHKKDKERLFENFKSLDSTYETILYSYEGNKSPELIRKYVTNRLDVKLLKMIIDEALNLSKGGIQILKNRKVYVVPKTPFLYLTLVKVPLVESTFIGTLGTIKPIFSIVRDIKTHREMISDRIRKPNIKRNMYREFIESLNEARKKGFISAEERREFNKKWRMEKDNRENLMEEISVLIKLKSETQR
jgi:hypothetical protein